MKQLIQINFGFLKIKSFFFLSMLKIKRLIIRYIHYAHEYCRTNPSGFARTIFFELGIFAAIHLYSNGGSKFSI